MKEIHPFDPIIDEHSKVLILGTFPSLDSFKYQFYYAHKRNQFWKILSSIFGEKLESDKAKTLFLLKQHIALWDIIRSCERKNSSDSNLKNIEPQAINILLQTYPNIKKIFFTGKKAQQIYMKYFKQLPIEVQLLPSPSPAYAAMRFEEKREIYKRVLLY
ncbi:MAG: DNA-deoxyinosine glycosylase [Epsilonproteobacteria bacterium]|nr:DNA-deoxyinosine glycosylase [Campylobacterota bacterium]